MKIKLIINSILHCSVAMAILLFSIWLWVQYFHNLPNGNLSASEVFALPPAILAVTVSSVLPLSKVFNTVKRHHNVN